MTTTTMLITLASLYLAATALTNLRADAAPPSSRTPEMVLQVGLAGQADSMAISPDKKILAAGGPGGEVTVWDLRTGIVLRRFHLPAYYRIRVAISPDSKILAAFAGQPGRVNLYEIALGRLLRVVSTDQLDDIAFSPDGKTVAFSAGNRVSLWNWRTGKQLRSITLHTGDSGFGTFAVFSPDGARLVTASTQGYDKTPLEIWDVKSGTLLGTLDAASATRSAAFSPDGKVIAVGIGHWPRSDMAVEIWDAASRKRIRTIAPSTSTITNVAFSSDGTTLTTANEGDGCRRWSIADGQQLSGAGTHGPYGIKVRISDDGTLGITSLDTGSIRIYDMSDGAIVRTIPGNPIRPGNIAFSGNGESLIQSGTVEIGGNWTPSAGLAVEWDTRTGRLKRRIASDSIDPYRQAMHASGRYAAVAGRGNLQVWDFTQGTARTIIKEDKTRDIRFVAISPDESLIAIAGQIPQPDPPGMIGYSGPGQHVPPLLEIYDLQTGQRTQTLPAHDENFVALQFTTDNTRLMSASHDGSVDFWNVKTGARTNEIHVAGWPDHAAMSKNGEMIAVRVNQSITLLDGATGTTIQTLPLSDSTSEGLALSPDGRLVALSDDSGLVRVWDTASGRLLHVLNTNAGPVNLAFSPDGSTLACLEASGAVQLWDPIKNRHRATLRVLCTNAGGHPQLEWFAQTPEGYYESSPGIEKLLTWRVGGVPKASPKLMTTFRRPDLVQIALTGKPQTALHAQIAKREARFQKDVQAEIDARVAAGIARDNPSAPETPTERLRAALSTMGDYDEPIRSQVAARIKVELAAGADPNTQGCWGTSPLIFFSAGNNVDEVKKLIERKVNLNLADEYGSTALINAAEYGHDDVIRLLLDAGAEFNDDAGHSLLALRNDRAALTVALLHVFSPDWRAGISISARNPVGTAYLLLQMGADAGVRNSDGESLLMLAGGYLSRDILFDSLLAHGADVNARDKRGKTALAVAAHGSKADVVRLLLEHGADPNTAELPDGYTPLLWAAQNAGADIVQMLLEHGANPNTQAKSDYVGWSPLHLAVWNGSLDKARVLIAHGADVNATMPGDRQTPIFSAVEKQDATMVRFLLDHGADITVRNKDGKTALQLDEETDPADHYGIHAMLAEADRRAPGKPAR